MFLTVIFVLVVVLVLVVVRVLIEIDHDAKEDSQTLKPSHEKHLRMQN